MDVKRSKVENDIYKALLDRLSILKTMGRLTCDPGHEAAALTEAVMAAMPAEEEERAFDGLMLRYVQAESGQALAEASAAICGELDIILLEEAGSAIADRLNAGKEW